MTDTTLAGRGPEEVTYTPQLYPVKDSIGNRYYAGIQYDEIEPERPR